MWGAHKMRTQILLSIAIAVGASQSRAQTPYVVLQYNTVSHSSEVKTHMIKSGETIHGILLHYFGTLADIEVLTEETVSSNSQAFRDGDANMMLAGQVLVLPTRNIGPEVADDIYHF